VRITTDTGNLTINGVIESNGNNGLNGIAGGSGGSILIYAYGKINGNGNITANGGRGSLTSGQIGGGGGGGRISFQSNFPFLGIVTAYGGDGPNQSGGGPGTIFFFNTAVSPGYRTLVIDNNNLNTSLTSRINDISKISGRFAWVIDNGGANFKFDEIHISGCGALIIKPGAPVSSFIIYLFIITYCYIKIYIYSFFDIY